MKYIATIVCEVHDVCEARDTAEAAQYFRSYVLRQHGTNAKLISVHSDEHEGNPLKSRVLVQSNKPHSS